MQQDNILTQLVAMSNRLGDPALDYVILGEGNTSARADADTFWVKASGTELRTIDRTGFVRVRFDRALALLGQGDLGDDAVVEGLEAAKADPTVAARPSVETVLHGLALQLEGVNFVGHTHPTAVVGLLSSRFVRSVVVPALTAVTLLTAIGLRFEHSTIAGKLHGRPHPITWPAAVLVIVVRITAVGVKATRSVAMMLSYRIVPFSASITLSPRPAASRAIPQPLTPPPIIRMSKGNFWFPVIALQCVRPGLGR